MTKPTGDDEFRGKGAVEQDRRNQTTNTSMTRQIGHRNKGPIIDNHDTDFPEPGQNPEHTGELMANPPRDQKNPEDEQVRREREADAVQDEVDQDPGDQQKRNQGDSAEDPLAA